MQAQLVSSRGIIATATRDYARGELVHAVKAFVNVPAAAVIRARSVCIGCYSATTVKKLAACKQGCGAVYCCAECREACAASHESSGECAVVKRVITEAKAPSNLDTDLLLVAAAVLLRAQREGYALPLLEHQPHPIPPNLHQQQTAQAVAKVEAEKRAANKGDAAASQEKNQDDSEEDMFAFFSDAAAQKEADAAAAAKEAERLAADIALVRGAPRECIADLFAGVLASRESLESAATAAAEAAAPPSFDLGAAAAPLFSAKPAATLRLPSDVEQGGGAAVAAQLASAVLEQDQQQRFLALQASGAPSFAEFCRLVSNVCVAPPTELERYDRVRKMFEAIFLHAAAAVSPHAANSSSSSNNKKHIDAVFFRHVCSTITMNCFGFFSGIDVLVGSGVFNSASFFNHSCTPSLLRRVACGKHEVFYAARDIRQGEELTISYAARFGEDGDKPAEFRQHLLRQYRFWCPCALCEKSAAVSAAPAATSASAPSGRNCCAQCFAKGDLRPLLPLESRLWECDTCFVVALKAE